MKQDLKDELAGSFLEKLEKKDIDMSVPSGFFENLAEEVLIKAKEPESLNTYKTRFYRPVLSLVASMAVIAAACLFLYFDQEKNTFEGVSNEELVEYAFELELDDTDIIGLDELESSISSLSTTEIDDHLETIVNDIDISSITEYL